MRQSVAAVREKKRYNRESVICMGPLGLEMAFQTEGTMFSRDDAVEGSEHPQRLRNTVWFD